MVQKKNKNEIINKKISLLNINKDIKLSKKSELSKIKIFSITYNFLYFFSKYWELGNCKGFVKNIIKFLPNTIIFSNKKLSKTKNNLKKKNIVLKYVSNSLLNLLINWYYYNIKKKFLYWKKKKIINQKNSLVYGFMLIRCTKNNFFVTIMDNKGNTLSARSGGNSGWIGTWQRSNVFSAESAMYESCFLAKNWGLRAIHVHIKSSLWLSQIKYSLEGIKVSGLKTLTVNYCPLKSFGGCREKKPRWV